MAPEPSFSELFETARRQMEPGAAPWRDPDMSLIQREPIPPPAWPRDLFPGDWGGFVDRAAEARHGRA